jgi:hypothetical protein
MRFATIPMFVLLSQAAWATIGFSQNAASPIDRHALVTRHNIVIEAADPSAAIAVGNGEFAFNCDITGMQSFPDFYEKTMPLGILSNWGWHSFPNPEGFSLDNFKMTVVQKHDRQFVYPASSTSNPKPDAAWLRTNPHRFGLGRIGLEMTRADGSRVAITDLQNVRQSLDLWQGLLSSSFTVDGVPVRVQTAVHGEKDEVGIRIDSPLVAAGRLKLQIAFPYASSSFGPDYQDWTKPDAHQTVMTPRADGADFARTLDATHYTVRAKWSANFRIAESGKHQFVLSANAQGGGGGVAGDQLDFAAWFAPAAAAGQADDASAVLAASAEGWKKYWSSGGAIDLSGTSDPRAAELERRIVLSQYVMKVHDGGSLPPQETGLAANSWFGKYHMEMYWWHSAHWGFWGRPEILEKSLDHLPAMMAEGQKMAKLEGCKGVKWAKMTGPDGVESPSGVGPVLVWQQPHPIYLSELVWRATKDKAVLERYKEIVFQTADYMATFVDFDKERNQFVLGPGVSSADEKHTDYAHNLNPTMELSYWRWALTTAQEWRTRLGMAPDPQWQNVIDHLAPLTPRNGLYTALEIPEERNASTMTTFMFGVLPGRDVDKEAMRNTLHAVSRMGATQTAITWGTAMTAMCAARLGEPDRALDLLVGKYNPGQNPFRIQGYTVRRPEQTPMYMPANGGWLSAVAIMAAGWDGHTEGNPGFPKEWKVRWEGLVPAP